MTYKNRIIWLIVMEVKVQWHSRRVLPLSGAVSVITASSGRAVHCVSEDGRANIVKTSSTKPFYYSSIPLRWTQISWAKPHPKGSASNTLHRDWVSKSTVSMLKYTVLRSSQGTLICESRLCISKVPTEADADADADAGPLSENLCSRLSWWNWSW